MEQNNGTRARNVCTVALLVDHAQPVLMLAMMCQCTPSRSHYRTTYAKEIDEMCVALRPCSVRGVLL